MNENFLESFSPIISCTSTTSGEVSRYFGDIFDLANAFLSIEPMTNKKLQKLCYYAKAWYLAINDSELIGENFEAWVHGAVQPSLYSKYRAYGFELIPMYTGEKDALPEEFISFANEIFNSYGDLDGDELERLNHKEEPWIKARQGLMPWESSTTIISNDDMKTYYRKLLKENEK